MSPLVAILTRTRNRQPMLLRTLQSVTTQTLPPSQIHWAILNDGGDPAPVESVADAARQKGFAVTVKHHPESRGLVHGLNVLLTMTPDESYCVVHDDDDSWEPAFLEKTSRYLDEHPDAAGCVTRATYVEETFENDVLKIYKRGPFNKHLVSYDLTGLMANNPAPPISILLRRAAVDEAGGYDESLPAVEDWDLMLKIAVHRDIGVIPEALANYHARPRATGAAGNTIHAGWLKHAYAASTIRNRYIRADLAAGRMGLGFLLALGERTRGVEELQRVSLVHGRVRGSWWFRWLRRLAGSKD